MSDAPRRIWLARDRRSVYQYAEDVTDTEYIRADHAEALLDRALYARRYPRVLHTYLGLGLFALAVLVTVTGILARDWPPTTLGLIALACSSVAIGHGLTPSEDT